MRTNPLPFTNSSGVHRLSHERGPAPPGQLPRAPFSPQPRGVARTVTPSLRSASSRDGAISGSLLACMENDCRNASSAGGCN